jgi:hypothetical protein
MQKPMAALRVVVVVLSLAGCATVRPLPKFEVLDELRANVEAIKDVGLKVTKPAGWVENYPRVASADPTGERDRDPFKDIDSATLRAGFEQILRVVTACAQFRDNSLTNLANRQQVVASAKKVTGILTGGFAAAGGLAAGTLSAVKLADASTITGYITAGVSLIGAIIVALFEPGSEVISDINRRLDQSAQGLATLENCGNPKAWAINPDKYFSAMTQVALLEGICGAVKQPSLIGR